MRFPKPDDTNHGGTLMPFKSPPPKKGHTRRIALKFRSDMTPKQFARFKKGVRVLAKRFKATISK